MTLKKSDLYSSIWASCDELRGGMATEIIQRLIDMDAGLSALEGRRDKTRALKQGMMQELLTGRTRLV